jgi:protein involved in polysaccharide export with SLBB domain
MTTRNYFIAIDHTCDNVKLQVDSVTIERGGTKVLKISLQPTDELVPLAPAAFAQKSTKQYMLDRGEILGVYIEGLLPYESMDTPAKSAFVSSSDQDPAIGFPIVVQDAGTISLPSIHPPLSVKALKIEQFTEQVRKSLLDAKIFSNPSRLRPIVTKRKERSYEVIVVR